jgi:phosphoribosylaminoimidazolecarboxamide formyltransferase/IMP cyclohydrolase
MRVLVIASHGSLATLRLAPTLATLAARGGRIEADAGAARDLTAEAIACVVHASDEALDAALRSLGAEDVLLAPLDTAGPGTAVADALAALTRALMGGAAAPLLLVDPADAGDLLAAIASGRTETARGHLARTATTRAIAALSDAHLRDRREAWPEHDLLILERLRTFSHGENPHQGAAAYRRVGETREGVITAPLAQGPEPTLNDLLDLDAGARLVSELPTPSVAIIRHTDPVGAATGETAIGALRRALETDPAAATGAVIALNAPIDRAVAVEITNGNFESVVAPEILDDGARELLATQSNLRVLLHRAEPPRGTDAISIAGALLLQEVDHGEIDRSQLRVVTARHPTLDELTDMLFSWRVVRHVRSNAIVIARDGATLGIGAGQANRRTAVEIALRRAGDRARTSVLASDAYFPLAEGIAAAAAAGVTAIIQPGGSRRDAAAIDIADRSGIAMVFTGRRHYRR